MKNKKILFGFFAITIALISGCNKQATSDVEIFLPIESTINISTEAPTDTTTTPSDEATNVITNSTEDIRSEENTGESSSKTEQSTEDIPVIAPVEPANVSLIAVGDMLLHGGIHTSSQQSDGSYDYTHVFEHVIDRIAAADIAVANQEVILGGAELGISSYPNFNAPYDFGNYLVKTGFDVILHASNHTMDKDTIGVLNTINITQIEGFQEFCAVCPNLTTIEGIDFSGIVDNSYNGPAMFYQNDSLTNITVNGAINFSWANDYGFNALPNLTFESIESILTAMSNCINPEISKTMLFNYVCQDDTLRPLIEDCQSKGWDIQGIRFKGEEGVIFEDGDAPIIIPYTGETQELTIPFNWYGRDDFQLNNVIQAYGIGCNIEVIEGAVEGYTHALITSILQPIP